MAYAVKFRHDYTKISGKTYRVDLELEGYGGGILDIENSMPVDPVKIQERGGGRPGGGAESKIIRGSELVFNFFSTVADAGQFDEIFTSTWKDYRLKYYEGATLLWQGYVEPENFTREFIGDQYEIHLSAADGLARLKDIDFVDASAGTIFDDEVKIILIIKRCMEHLDIQLDFKVQVNTIENNYMTTSECVAQEVELDCFRFLGNVDGRLEVRNCFEVLEEVVKIWSATMRQIKGNWWIVADHEIDSPLYTYTYAALTQSRVASNDLELDISAYDFRGEGTKEIIQPIKTHEVTFFNFNKGNTAIVNGDFQDSNNWDEHDFFGWGASGGVGTLQSFPDAPFPQDAGSDLRLESDAFSLAPTGSDTVTIYFSLKLTTLSSPSPQQDYAPAFNMELHKGASNITASDFGTTFLIVGGDYISMSRTFPISVVGSDYSIHLRFSYPPAGNWDTAVIAVKEFYSHLVYADGSEIVRDAVHISTNNDTDETKITKESILFSDSGHLDDIGQTTVGGVPSADWKRYGKTEELKLANILGLNKLVNYATHKEYVKIKIQDEDDIIQPYHRITMGGKTYRIDSYKKSHFDRTMDVDLEEFLTADPANSYSVAPLTSTDGSSGISSGGFVPPSASFVSWDAITGKPTTLAGYAIVDDKAGFDAALSDGGFMYVGDAWNTGIDTEIVADIEIVGDGSEQIKIRSEDVAGTTYGQLWVEGGTMAGIKHVTPTVTSEHRTGSTRTISSLNISGAAMWVLLDSDGIEFREAVANSGAFYAADYSTAGVADHANRWIPDVGYNTATYAPIVHTHAIDDLTDFNMTSLGAAGELMYWDGAKWINQFPTEIGLLADDAAFNDLADVDTSGGVVEGSMVVRGATHWNSTNTELTLTGTSFILDSTYHLYVDSGFIKNTGKSSQIRFGVSGTGSTDMFIFNSEQYQFDDGPIVLEYLTAPTTNISAHGKLYADTADGLLYWRDQSGSVFDLTASGAGTTFAGLTDTNISGQVNYSTLSWVGSDWVNRNDTLISDLGLHVFDGIPTSALPFSVGLTATTQSVKMGTFRVFQETANDILIHNTDDNGALLLASNVTGGSADSRLELHGRDATEKGGFLLRGGMPTTDVVTGDSYIQGAYAFSGASTNLDGGHLYLDGGLEQGIGTPGNVYIAVNRGQGIFGNGADDAPGIAFDNGGGLGRTGFNGDSTTITFSINAIKRYTMNIASFVPNSTIDLGLTGDPWQDLFFSPQTAATVDGDHFLMWNATSKKTTYFDISGTPSGTTFLRGDGQWAIASGGASALAGLSDVDSATQTSGFVIASTGGNYAGRQLSGSELNNDQSWAADQTTIVGITGTKAQFDTAVTDGDIMYDGDPPTSHTLLGHTISGETAGHVLAANSATTFSIRQLLGSEISNTESWAADQTATLTPGTGLAGSVYDPNTSRTWSLDFSELTDMTGDISGTTEFILQNGTTESRKAANEIKLSAFNDDLTYDNYVSWNLKTDSVQRTTVTSGGDLDIVGGTDISVGYSAGGVVTINSTFTETSHSDVLVDGDFSSNGLMKRTGAGVYGIVTDNSATWNTALQDITGELLSDLSDVPAYPSGGSAFYVLRWSDTGNTFAWYDEDNYLDGAGTVTSVAISGTDGIDVDSGSPITGSGTIQLGLSNIGNSALTNSTISGVSLGSNLAALTAGTGIGISAGTYTGATARTITLALGELSVTTMVAGDWIAFDDAGTSRKALISAIPLSLFNNDDGWTADQTTIVGITGTKAQFDTAVTGGDFMYIGDAPTSHTLLGHTISGETSGHVLAANSATTFSIRQLLGSEISNTENWNNYVHPTTAGNKHIPSGGATDEILTYAGSSGTAQWSAPAGAGTMEAATFYDNTGGQSIAGTATVMNLDATLRNNSTGNFSLASDVATVADADDYLISYSVGATLGSSTRDGVITWVEVNTGGGYVEVPGSRGSFYGRITTEQSGSASASFVFAVGAGDLFRVVAMSTGVAFISDVDNTTLSFVRLTGAKGVQGIPGADGAGQVASLTTTGTSGAATLISNVLNIPNYLPSATLTAGAGISGTTYNPSTSTTFALDFSELSVGGTLLATDHLIAANGSAENRQLISAIPLGIFNNNSGWTSNVGTVTSVGTTGTVNGITLTGTVTTSGSLTLGGTLGGISNGQLTNSTISGVSLGSNLAALTAGTGLASAGTYTGATSRTFSLDFSELTDMTGDVAAADQFIIQDGTVESRKAASEIKLSVFNNDLGAGFAGFSVGGDLGANQDMDDGDILDIPGADGIETTVSKATTVVTLSVALKLSELTDMTAGMIGADEFIVLDAGAQRRKAANEINLSIFNDDIGAGSGGTIGGTISTGGHIAFSDGADSIAGEAAFKYTVGTNTLLVDNIEIHNIGAGNNVTFSSNAAGAALDLDSALTIVGTLKGANLNISSTPTAPTFTTAGILARDTSGVVRILVAAGASTGRFLKDDGTWATPSAGSNFYLNNVTYTGTVVTLVVNGAANQTIVAATASAAGTVTNTTQSFAGLKTFNTGVNVTGTMAATTVTGTNVTSGANPGHTHTGSSISGLDAGSDITSGTLVVGRGGTGNVSFPTNYLITGNGTGSLGGEGGLQFDGAAVQLDVGVPRFTGFPTYHGNIRINSEPTTLNAHGGLEFFGDDASNGSGHRISHIETAGDLVFESRHDTATWTERMRIQADGEFAFGSNVGGGGTANFLRADGAWAAPTASASNPTIDTQSTNRNIVDADNGNIIECTAGLIITFPDTLNLAIGWSVQIVNMSTGTVTLATSGTATMVSKGTKLQQQYGSCYVYQTGAANSDDFVAIGDLTT